MLLLEVITQEEIEKIKGMIVNEETGKGSAPREVEPKIQIRRPQKITDEEIMEKIYKKNMKNTGMTKNTYETASKAASESRKNTNQLQNHVE